MKSRIVLPLLVMGSLGAFALAGCKPKEKAVGEPQATAASASVAAASAATPPIAAPAQVKPFDVTSVPMSTAVIPPFPFFEMPAGTDGYHKDAKDFDRAWVIAGEELRAVEGRTSERWFPPSAVKMSTLAAFRNYEAAIKSLGGVRVDKVHPLDPAFIARNGGDKEALLKKLAIPNSRITAPDETPTFSQYLVRTPKGNIWIALIFFDGDLNLSIEVVQEQAMEQTVALVKADDMAAALAKDGHIALYLNFDNDSDSLRADSKPAIDEIAKMLAADGSLKVRVEGHTDNTGTAARNTALSRARAESVVKAISSMQISKDRLKPEGLGSGRPLADNSSEEGRAKNRRVELVKI